MMSVRCANPLPALYRSNFRVELLPSSRQPCLSTNLFQIHLLLGCSNSLLAR
jgi:hypothetical protein